MKEASFLVAYDGPGVADGRMSVRQLAPALLAVGGVIEESNRILNGEHAHVSVRIRPANRPGSALIDLTMQVGLVDQLRAFADVATLTDAQQMLALLGFLDPEGRVASNVDTIRNVIEFIKALAGKSIEGKITLEDGNIQLNMRDNNGEIHVYNAPKNVVLLGSNRGVREHFEDLVSDQLDDPLIEEFQVRDPEDVDRVVERVSKDESEGFRVPRQALASEDEVEEGGFVDWVEEGEFVDWVTVRKSWTVESNRKWQFETSTGTPFNAPIKDEAFWQDMQTDKYSVTPHAKFRVRVQWHQEADTDPEHKVTEVLEYEPSEPQQQGFDLDSSAAMPSPSSRKCGRRKARGDCESR